MDTSSDSLSDLSSELSSIGSRSPTPPFSYPSPQSSQHCDNISTEAQETTSRKRPRGGGEDPTRKKRKTEGEKSRKTERLDLRTPREPGSPEPYGQLNVLLQALRKRRKIVVIAGAGISTSAGSTSVELSLFYFLLLSLTILSSRLSILQWLVQHFEK